MRKCLILLAMLLLAAVATANEYRLSDIRVVDGDTIQADVALGWGVVLDDQRIRFVGVDAPELKPRLHHADGTAKTADEIATEKAAAQAAAAFLHRLLDGQSVVLRTDEPRRDGFGRILGALYIGHADGTTTSVVYELWIHSHVVIVGEGVEL